MNETGAFLEFIVGDVGPSVEVGAGMLRTIGVYSAIVGGLRKKSTGCVGFTGIPTSRRPSRPVAISR